MIVCLGSVFFFACCTFSGVMEFNSFYYYRPSFIPPSLYIYHAYIIYYHIHALLFPPRSLPPSLCPRVHARKRARQANTRDRVRLRPSPVSAIYPVARASRDLTPRSGGCRDTDSRGCAIPGMWFCSLYCFLAQRNDWVCVEPNLAVGSVLWKVLVGSRCVD